MTWTELITEIQFETQTEGDTDSATRITSILNDELVNLANLQDQQALHVSRLSITSASQDGTSLLISLPSDFLKTDRIEYKSSTTEWILSNRDGLVPPPPIVGKPKAYELNCLGLSPYKLRLIPSIALNSDTVLLSYYMIPPAVSGGTTIYPSSWIPTLKKATIERMLIYAAEKNSDKAQMFMQMEQKAEAGQSVVNQEIMKSDKSYDSPRSA